MSLSLRLLSPADAHYLERVAPETFDNEIDPVLVAEFLNDRRHHIVVAIDGDIVVGFVSALHYLHPDKPAELWINEVAVAPTHQRAGIGTAMLRRMLEHGKELGCTQAWVLTDPDNLAANLVYQRCGGMAAAGVTVMYEFQP
ncbi:MAG TPA: GNAT family N-acetyltransferase [Gemmatimonadales bacterium]|jgi:aminoglycoside 6'-N-acetyltransferase I